MSRPGPRKSCDDCGATASVGARHCPVCGYSLGRTINRDGRWGR